MKIIKSLSLLSFLAASHAHAMETPGAITHDQETTLAAQQALFDQYKDNSVECLPIMESIISECDKHPTSDEYLKLKRNALKTCTIYWRKEYIDAAKDSAEQNHYSICYNASICVPDAIKSNLHKRLENTKMKSTDWRLRAAAIAAGDRLLVNLLSECTPHDPLSEWDNTLELFRKIQKEFETKKPWAFDASLELRQNLATFLPKACVIFDAGIERIIDQKTANEIHDILCNVANTYACSTVKDQLYDYTSDDRHMLRPVNPFYWARQCKRYHAAPDAAPASSTQSSQTNTSDDDHKKNE
jgi:hypothetical protein